MNTFVSGVINLLFLNNSPAIVVVLKNFGFQSGIFESYTFINKPS